MIQNRVRLALWLFLGIPFPALQAAESRPLPFDPAALISGKQALKTPQVVEAQGVRTPPPPPLGSGKDLQGLIRLKMQERRLRTESETSQSGQESEFAIPSGTPAGWGRESSSLPPSVGVRPPLSPQENSASPLKSVPPPIPVTDPSGAGAAPGLKVVDSTAPGVVQAPAIPMSTHGQGPELPVAVRHEPVRRVVLSEYELGVKSKQGDTGASVALAQRRLDQGELATAKEILKVAHDKSESEIRESIQSNQYSSESGGRVSERAEREEVILKNKKLLTQIQKNQLQLKGVEKAQQEANLNIKEAKSSARSGDYDRAVELLKTARSLAEAQGSALESVKQKARRLLLQAYREKRMAPQGTSQAPHSTGLSE
jgi:hypothetical protein